MADVIKALEAKTNDKIPQLAAGDTVSVHVKIKEGRSEEHTSELQSHSEISYAVFCLKKKKK